jgi:thiamine-phosphate pyrophosphorylase
MRAKFYALIDSNLLKKYNKSLDEIVEICNKKNIDIVQYRDKSGEIEKIKENLLFLKENFNGKIIVNDYIELVRFCDGIHLGQDDILKINSDKLEAVKLIREEIKDKILGLSTHNKEEILEANRLEVDYIGLGAFRETNTKSGAKVISQDIENLIKLSEKKVAVIGGVRFGDEIKGAWRLVVGSALFES